VVPPATQPPLHPLPACSQLTARIARTAHELEEGLGGEKPPTPQRAEAEATTPDEKARKGLAEQSLRDSQRVEDGLRSGQWEGHCIVQGERIGLAMDLAFTPNADHTGTTVTGGGEDRQGAFDVRGITLPNGKVRLEKEWRETSEAAGYVVSFEGASFSGKIAGQWKEGDLSGAFVLVHQA
jgi:hypothetical protein